MIRLSHREEKVMQILWKLEKAFVKEIIEEMEVPKPPYNTISSVARKLAEEGVIGYRSFGKSHQYYPILKREDYRKTKFKRFINNYFSGDPEKLLSYFMEEKELDEKEINGLLKKIIDKDDDRI